MCEDCLHSLQPISRILGDSHRVFTGQYIEEGINACFAKRAPVFTAGRHGSRQEKTEGDRSMSGLSSRF